MHFLAKDLLLLINMRARLLDFVVTITIALTFLVAVATPNRGIVVRYTLHGFSNHPTIQNGADLYVEVTFPIEEIKVGDFIIYRSLNTKEKICHRVVRKDGTDLLFVKGDNNRFRDNYIVGRMSYAGKVIKFKNPEN